MTYGLGACSLRSSLRTLTAAWLWFSSWWLSSWWFSSWWLSPAAAFPLNWAQVQASGTEETCPTALTTQIAAITQRPEFRQSHWGILAQTVEPNPQTLYAQNAEKFFVPASNVKLLTTAAALTQLGAEFRIRTSVYQLPDPSGQVILRVVGRGDPSFSEAQLQALVQQIRDRLGEQGLNRIDHLIADDQYFQGDPIHPTWEWEDLQAGYGASVNSLMLNQNAINLTLIPQALGQPLSVSWDDPIQGRQWQIINASRTVAANQEEFVQVGRDWHQPILRVAGQLRVGSASEPVAISVPQPTQYFLEQLQQHLQTAQISVERATVAVDPLPTAFQETTQETIREIAAIDSPPLAKLLVETNQQSQNLYAESLLRQLVAALPAGSPGDAASGDAASEPASTLARGIAQLESSLLQLGVDPSLYQLADGSGLSRHNAASPAALVQTLQALARSPELGNYRASLARAGISGTLQSRFRDTNVAGNFYGKTGALTGATALSGYLELEDGSLLAVSILVNQSAPSLGATQAAIDAIVQILFQSSAATACPSTTAS